MPPSWPGSAGARPLLADDRLVLFGYTPDRGVQQQVMTRRGLAGLVVTELNPDQGAEDGSTADTLVGGLVGALAG